MAVSSIFSRKRDLCYLIYFLLHIPIMFRKPISYLPPFWAAYKTLTNRNSRRSAINLSSRPRSGLHELPPHLVHRHLCRCLLHVTSRFLQTVHVSRDHLSRAHFSLGHPWSPYQCVPFLTFTLTLSLSPYPLFFCVYAWQQYGIEIESAKNP